jgi:lauroyl/myristoyl acyltransferase
MPLPSLFRRFSVYGDFWTRLMEWAVRHCPSWLEPLLLGCWALLFFTVCGSQRRAVVGNLRAMFPNWSFWRAQAGALRVVWNFSWSLTDAIRASGGQDVIDWEIDGLESFRKLAASEGGAIVLTAHMGNYDLAAPVFAGRFGRRLNAVRAPEREVELQEHYQRRREGQESDAFAVRYNADGGMLGIELASLLGAGELVALQGDRVLFEVSPAVGELFGREVKLPKGPYALALAGKAPVWPLFIIRDGWRRYRIRVSEPFVLVAPRAERERVMREGIASWCGELEAVLRESWYQWFVFEPAFVGDGEVEE